MLRVEHVNKDLKDFSIKDVSFHLEPGYIMGLIGRNGAGKTTLMRLILGAYKRTSGRVTINGYDLDKEEVKAKGQIGFILDDTPFIEGLTVDENVKLFAPFYEEWDEEKFRSYLRKFKIPSAKLVVALSKGMQTKLQLAFALAHHPRLLIMDEPTGGLDPLFRKEFLNMMQEIIATEEMSILISTHLTSDLDKIADYITMIDDGKILFSKSKEELMDECYIVKGSMEDYDKIFRGEKVELVRKRERFEAFIQNAALAKRLREQTDYPLVLERATLEDIMYYRTRRKM